MSYHIACMNEIILMGGISLSLPLSLSVSLTHIHTHIHTHTRCHGFTATLNRSQWEAQQEILRRRNGSPDEMEKYFDDVKARRTRLVIEEEVEKTQKFQGVAPLDEYVEVDEGADFMGKLNDFFGKFQKQK